MRSRSLFDTHRRPISAAFLAVYASHGTSGFRQRDVRFYFELFLAWCDGFIHTDMPHIENTQFKRLLETFTKEGFARRSKSGKTQRYLLTRGGLLEVSRLLVEGVSPSKINEALFVLYFISNYGPRIEKLAMEGDEHHTSSALIALRDMLDPRALRTKLLSVLQHQIDTLNAYSDKCDHSAERTKSMLRAGGSLSTIVEYLQKNNPYHLNNQKPLKELSRELVPDHALWELTEGLQARSVELWKPLIAVLQCYQGMINRKL